MWRKWGLGLSFCALLLCLLGCQPQEVALVDSEEAMQEFVERIDLAKEFATQCFQKEMLSQGMDYEVLETACGFITAEVPVYIVGFQYEANGIKSTYGYEIVLDEHKTCQLRAEGRPIADFVFPK